jgi:ATP-dependent helicase/nuclease subunit B
MNPTVVVSVASSRRIARAKTWLTSRPQTEEVLVVGATLDAANELARQVVQDKGAAFGWHRLSFSQLAATIAAPLLAERGLVSLSRVGTEAIVARLVHRLRIEGKLGRYQSVSEMPGFPRAMTNVIAELRSARLRSNEVEAVVPDLVPIFREYEHELAEGGFTDWPGTLEVAANAIAGVDQHRLVGLPILFLDVHISTEAEFTVVTALTGAAPAMLATIPSADTNTLERFRDRLGFRTESLDLFASGEAGGKVAGALARLQRHLFNEHEKPFEIEAGTQIEIFSAPGEGRECVEIARRVLALARDGVSFDRIAVLLRSPEVCRSHLAEAFSRSEIPVHFARGAVRPEPVGRAFFALLECAAEGLSARKFAEYLSLGQVPDAVADGAPPEAPSRGDLWVAPDAEVVPGLLTNPEGNSAISPAECVAETSSPDAPVREGQLRAPRRWEQLLVDSAVIGGRDRWRRRLDGLANDLRRRLVDLDRQDEMQVAAISRELDDLAAFSSYALPLIDELDSLPAAAPWREWLDRLGVLAARSLKRPHRVLAVLAELELMASVGPVGLREVLGVLQNLLLEAAEPPLSQRYGKLFVGPIEAARGLSFDAVFIPGLAEKMFPSKIVEEPILLDAVRKRISADLVTNQTRLDRERLALSLAAGAAEQRIFFSYPRIDLDQARSRVPSFYALEAVRSAEGRLPDFGELARRAETAAASRLGWPAPRDPSAAIDDAEHDLAIIDDLMNQPKGGAGGARYLLTANPHLARALRSRYQRWSRGWTVFDGLLSLSTEVRAVMAKHALSARSYSPTTLQNFSRCPYSFFIHAIQGIVPRDIPIAIDDLDPLQRGSLIHDVQFELFARLTSESLLPVRPGNLERARLLLEEVITEVASRHEDDLAPAIDQVWKNAVAAIRADLREWLRRMSEDTSGFVPRHFELFFGLPHWRAPYRDADRRSVPEAVGLDCGIQLRGSIDLVERHPSGLFRVIDHKTGKCVGTNDPVIEGGKSLQPVLYALAAEKLFAGEGEVSEGRLYFCTSAGQFSEQVVALDERARNAAADVATAIGQAIERPFLPAAPSEGQCEGCDYRAVCGPYEELRSARKPQGDLELLQGLRAWK